MTALYILAIIIGAVLCWRFSRRRKKRAGKNAITALVFLTKEPRKLADWQVRQVVSQVLGAEFVMGDQPSPNRIVAVAAERVKPSLPPGAGTSYAINAGAQRFLINSFNIPYMPEPEKFAETIGDLRLREAVGGHKAWISVDLLGEPGSSAARKKIYGLLGQMLAPFGDDDCLAIYCPELERCNEYAPKVVEQLRSGQPLEIFSEPTNAPIVNISGSDPRMVAAVAEAKQRWPEFVVAFQARSGGAKSPFIIKARFTDGSHEEFMWVSVTAIENETISGKLENSPGKLTNVKLGDAVTVPLADLNDWLCQIDGKAVGGFTMKLISEKMRAAK